MEPGGQAANLPPRPRREKEMKMMLVWEVAPSEKESGCWMDRGEAAGVCRACGVETRWRIGWDGARQSSQHGVERKFEVDDAEVVLR